MTNDYMFNNTTFYSEQKACSTQENVLSSINLYNGVPAFPISLVTLDGKDNLTLSVQATYQGNIGNTMYKLNMDSSSSVLGFGFLLPITRIGMRNRTAKNNYQADYYLISEGGQYPLYRTDGNNNIIQFKSVEHPFWKIAYHNTADKSYWEIWKEDGSIWIYGGSSDSIETGLSWDNWVGPTVCNGGEEYPFAWCLSRVQSFHGASILYEYENIKEPIGDKTYTRAIRYASVTSTYGERVTFHYKPKENFECPIPHMPNDVTNAYQYNYDDVYLDKLQIWNRDGVLKFIQKLEYEIDKGHGLEKAKRFLTGVVQINPFGERLPGLYMSYEKDLEAPIPGALTRVQYPKGSALLYTYQKADIINSRTTATWYPPEGDWKTSLYQGTDFTVSVYSTNTMIHIKVNYWNTAFYFLEDTVIAAEAVDDYNVFIGDGFFALLYHKILDARWKIKLYKRNPVRQHQWNMEELPMEAENNRPAVACGSDFLAVQYSNQNTLLIAQYNYIDLKWHYTELPVECRDYQAIGAGHGFIMGAYYQVNGEALRLQTFYCNESHEWVMGDYRDQNIKIEWQLTNAFSVWSVGEHLASATFVAIIDKDTAISNIVILRWRNDFIISDVISFSLTQNADVKNPILYSAVNDSMIGFAQHLFRYTPGNWNQRTFLTPVSGGEYYYAYGLDLALALEYKDGIQKFYSLRFDPYLQAWADEGAPHVQDRIGEKSRCLPYIFGEYAILGRQLFTRDNREHWQCIYYFDNQVDMESLQLREDGEYLLYQLTDYDEVYMLNLFNRSPSIIWNKEGEHCLSHGTRFAAHDYFCTYTGDNLANANHFTMYRVSNASFYENQPIAMLKSIGLDTGVDLQEYYFDYDKESAAVYDNRVDFERVKVRLGREDKYLGCTEYIYYNGRPPEDPLAFYPKEDDYNNVASYYSCFTGRLYETKVYDKDNLPVSGNTNYEQVMDPYGYAIFPRKNLRHTYLPVFNEAIGKNQNSLLRIEDLKELQEVIEYEYMPEYHFLRKMIHCTTDGNGNMLQVSQNYLYGFEVYDELLQEHLFDMIVQTVKYENLSQKILEATASRWEIAKNGKMYETEKYRWDGSQNADFLFQPEQEGWFTTHRVLGRKENGSILCQQSEDNTLHSLFYDTTDSFLIADFTNAYPNEAFFCSFEPYEPVNGIEHVITDELCYIGTRCLMLEAVKAPEVSWVLSEVEVKKPYLLQLAIKSETADTGKSQAYVLITVTRTDGTSNTLKILLTAVDTSWKVFRNQIPLDKYVPKGEKVNLELRLCAGSEGKSYVDTIFFTPADCQARADVYDINTLLIIGSFNNMEKGSMTLYDRLSRPMIGIFEEGVLNHLTCRDDGYVEEYTKNRLKSSNSRKSSILSSDFAGFGKVYPIFRGMDFTKDWDMLDGWKHKNRKLVHDTFDRASLKFKGNITNEFMYYIATQEEEGAGLIFQLGEQQLHQYKDGWQFYENNSLVSDMPCKKYYQNDYVIIKLNKCTRFLVNGIEVFSIKEKTLVPPLEDNKLSIEVSSPCTFNALGYSTSPKTCVSYTDYTGRPLQDQIVTSEGILVMQSLYSELGQAHIQTKPVEYAGELWGYRDEMVINFDSETGVMTGKVSEVYPEDEGYPYIQSIMKICPEPYPVEFAQPGKNWSAFQPDEQKNTVRLGKYTNSSQFRGLQLSPSMYYIEKISDSNGKCILNYKDGRKNLIAQVVYGHDGKTQKTTYEYNANNQPVAVYYPNYFSDRIDAKNYVGKMKYDGLGNLIERTEPDVGTVRTVCDQMGRIRFMQDAVCTSLGGYLYYTYDDKGREIEVGFCKGTYDYETLKKAVEYKNRRPANSTWSKQMEYDGDGVDPFLLGHLWKARTKTNDAIIEEILSYDQYGNLTEKSQRMIPDNNRTNYNTQFSKEETIFMSYDNLGNITELSDDSKLISIRYVYDLQGKMREIYWKDICICRYTYTPNGNILTETYDCDSSTPLLRKYSYNSAHWLTELTDDYFSQSFKYNNASGKITSMFYHFSDMFKLPEGFLHNSNYEYQYDSLDRLIYAQNITYPSFSIGMLNAFSYDNNSNLLEYDDKNYIYSSGNNQLSKLNISGQSKYLSADNTFQYNEIGSVTGNSSHGIMNIIYDPVLQKVTGIQTNEMDPMRKYYYSSTNGIIAMDTNNSLTVHILDKDGKTLVDRSNGKPCILIRGVNEVFAMIYEDEIYYLLRDYQLSVRAIVNKGILCAAYNYMPFGEYMGRIYEKDVVKELVKIRFTGQIIDDTGLYRMKARWYDPVTGRFLSIDPESQYPSPYLYGGGDWINYFDPSGSFNWGAFLSIAVGVSLIIAGAAISVATAGMASPIGAFLATIGTAALIGAGIGGTIYGFSSIITGKFSIGECLINFGAGALFGAVAAGAGALVPAGFTVLGLSTSAFSTIMDIGVGIVVGGSDGLITNGCINVVNHENFFKNGLTNAAIGMAVGGLASGISGLGTALRNAKTIQGGQRLESIRVGLGPRGHSSVFADIPPNSAIGASLQRNPAGNVAAEVHWNIPPGVRTTRIQVDLPTYNRFVGGLAQQTAPGTYAGRFNSITHNSVRLSLECVSAAEIYTPLWAKTGPTLYLWAKLLGAFQ